MSWKCTGVGEGLDIAAGTGVMGTIASDWISFAFWYRRVGAFPSGLENLFFVAEAAYPRYWMLQGGTYTAQKSLMLAYHSASGNRTRVTASGGVLSTIDDGNWHHIAVTAYPHGDMSDWHMYYDGVDRSGVFVSTSGGDDFSGSLSQIHCSQMGLTNYYAEIGIWRGALAPYITDLYTNKKTPSIVFTSGLKHCWTLNTAHTSNGLIDTKGITNLRAVSTSVTDASHPAGIDYGVPTTVAKYDIVTNASDGTVRKLFVWTDTTQTAFAVANVDVTASGGHFKYTHASATLGSSKPAMLTGFGANESAVATGGACWATGIAE